MRLLLTAWCGSVALGMDSRYFHANIGNQDELLDCCDCLMQREVDTTIDRLEALRGSVQTDGTATHQLQVRTQQAKRKLGTERSARA